MGANGGFVFLPLKQKQPSKGYKQKWEIKQEQLENQNFISENDRAVRKLLEPFYQFLSLDDISYWAKEANYEFEHNEENFFMFHKSIYGHYGSDRFDAATLEDLRELCEPSEEFDSMTFAELDLDYRTANKQDYQVWNHPWRQLWHSHFCGDRQEYVLSHLSKFKIDDITFTDLTIGQWKEKLKAVCYPEQVYTEETWT